MNRIAIYTAIFGDRQRDFLLEQKIIPENCDYICYTDRPLKSKVWQVRQVTPPMVNDPVRSARMYKVLPHRHLGSYEVSLWIDSYIWVKRDVNNLVDQYLANNDIAIYDHMQIPDARDCIYDEAQALMDLASVGNYKDDPKVMMEQVERYRAEGYPAHHGLISSMIILRRHHQPLVSKTMEDWWQEIKQGSRRDQLSFNYVAWKNNLSLTYLPGDSRNNEYFKSLR